MDVKVVFLDVDNTLLDFDACAADAMRRSFADFGLEYRDEMFPVFTAENDVIWKDIEKGILTRADLPKVRWQRILPLLGLSADGVAMEEQFRRYLEVSAVEVPGALQLLRYLAGRYTLCAASNGPYAQQLYRLKKAGMLPYFAHCFVSEQIGHEKPGRLFFDGCLARLPGIRPEQCVMVGDSLTADISGGRAYGMRTIWFDFRQKGYTGAMPADAVICSLKELERLL